MPKWAYYALLLPPHIHQLNAFKHNNLIPSSWWIFCFLYQIQPSAQFTIKELPVEFWQLLKDNVDVLRPRSAEKVILHKAQLKFEAKNPETTVSYLKTSLKLTGRYSVKVHFDYFSLLLDKYLQETHGEKYRLSKHIKFPSTARSIYPDTPCSSTPMPIDYTSSPSSSSSATSVKQPYQRKSDPHARRDKEYDGICEGLRNAEKNLKIADSPIIQACSDVEFDFKKLLA